MTNTNVKKCILYILIVAAFIAVLSILFYPRNNYNPDTTDAISGNTLLGEPDNTVDVVFVGNSQAYTSLCPSVIYEESGINSYVCAVAAQPICETIDFVKAAFINQQPKLVVMEADVIFEDVSLAKYAYTKLKNVIPILQYHDRWKKIGTREFTLYKDFTNKDPLKGYNNDDIIQGPNWKTDGYMENDFDGSYINKAVEISIYEMKNICDKYGCRFLILSTPNLEWSNARTENIQRVADKYGITYLDLNSTEEMSDIDWYTMSKDYGMHLNNYGAEIVSRYMAAYLEKAMSG